LNNAFGAPGFPHCGKAQRDRLQRAKTELKRQFGKDQTRHSGAREARTRNLAL
jgi:hypothetical protein